MRHKNLSKKPIRNTVKRYKTKTQGKPKQQLNIFLKSPQWLGKVEK